MNKSELKRIAVQTDKCKCTMSISVLGDGCRYCQPQEYIDRLHELIIEERAEFSKEREQLLGKMAMMQESLKRIAGPNLQSNPCSIAEETLSASQPEVEAFLNEVREKALKDADEKRESWSAYEKELKAQKDNNA